jgi:hypothetical protein
LPIRAASSSSVFEFSMDVLLPVTAARQHRASVGRAARQWCDNR